MQFIHVFLVFKKYNTQVSSFAHKNIKGDRRASLRKRRCYFPHSLSDVGWTRHCGYSRTSGFAIIVSRRAHARHIKILTNAGRPRQIHVHRHTAAAKGEIRKRIPHLGGVKVRGLSKRDAYQETDLPRNKDEPKSLQECLLRGVIARAMRRVNKAAEKGEDHNPYAHKQDSRVRIEEAQS